MTIGVSDALERLCVASLHNPQHHESSCFFWINCVRSLTESTSVACAARSPRVVPPLPMMFRTWHNGGEVHPSSKTAAESTMVVPSMMQYDASLALATSRVEWRKYMAQEHMPRRTVTP